MQYEKEMSLKDGAKCLLRGAGEADAAEVLRTFDLTHAETDYLLTYILLFPCSFRIMTPEKTTRSKEI